MGIAQWFKRQTCGWKVPGSSTRKRIFFSRVNFLCWLLLRYPFHPCVTAIAYKRSWSFCQTCRWQVTAKHTCTIPVWLKVKWHCKVVHGYMVYTELVLRQQQFHLAPTMQQPNSAVSTLWWILLIRAIKVYSHSFRITTVTHSESHVSWAQWACSRAENSAV